MSRPPDFPANIDPNKPLTLTPQQESMLIQQQQLAQQKHQQMLLQQQQQLLQQQQQHFQHTQEVLQQQPLIQQQYQELSHPNVPPINGNLNNNFNGNNQNHQNMMGDCVDGDEKLCVFLKEYCDRGESSIGNVPFRDFCRKTCTGCEPGQQVNGQRPALGGPLPEIKLSPPQEQPFAPPPPLPQPPQLPPPHIQQQQQQQLHHQQQQQPPFNFPDQFGPNGQQPPLPPHLQQQQQQQQMPPQFQAQPINPSVLNKPSIDISKCEDNGPECGLAITLCGSNSYIHNMKFSDYCRKSCKKCSDSGSAESASANNNNNNNKSS